MKRLPRWFVAVAVVATGCLVLFSTPQSASANVTAISVILTCSSLTATGTTGAQFLGIEATWPGSYARQVVAASHGVATGTVTFPHQPDGTVIEVAIYGADNPSGHYDGESLYDHYIACHDNSNAATYFSPGDGRLNGEPGDRLVVYCNANQTPANIDVFVIDPSSVGHELTKIPLSDLTSVAEGKFSKNLGVNGVLFAGSDANGNGYTALQGGPYSGTATGGWLKTFSCKAS